MALQISYFSYRLGWCQGAGCQADHHHRDQRGWMIFLAGARRSPDLLMRFRSLLRHRAGGLNLRHISDERLLSEMAHRLTIGEMCTNYAPRELYKGRPQDVEKKTPAQKYSAPPPPPPKPNQPPPEESVFSDDLDFDSAAAAMEQAAALGIPFCEECEKARLNAAKPPPAVIAPPAEEAVQVYWVEIELLGEDGEPISGEEYEIKLPSGEIVRGVLDGGGWARADNIPQSGECQVTFPKLDKDAWVAHAQPQHGAKG